MKLSHGQSAAATLRALTASRRYRNIDPALGHHRDVIVSWASCVWDGTPGLDIMQQTLEHAVRKLRTFHKPWQGVVDPAGTLLLTLGRIGWSAASARHFYIEKGMAIDLLASAPKGLVPRIDAATSSWGDQMQVHGWSASIFGSR